MASLKLPSQRKEGKNQSAQHTYMFTILHERGPITLTLTHNTIIECTLICFSIRSWGEDERVSKLAEMAQMKTRKKKKP